jgi:hypothetical protein
MKKIPAVPYWNIILVFAQSHELKFFTWNDFKKAQALYHETNKKIN